MFDQWRDVIAQAHRTDHLCGIVGFAMLAIALPFIACLGA